MGKWADRLAAHLAVVSGPPAPVSTDKTDTTTVLSVLAVPREGGAASFSLSCVPGDTSEHAAVHHGGATAKTDTTRVSSVLSAPTGAEAPISAAPADERGEPLLRDAEDELEAIEERAAILEFDAGLPRAVAEQQANGMEGEARVFLLQREGARPRRLTKHEADAAHAEPWSEPVIAGFTARVQSLARRGLGQEDAEHVAERLYLRDLEGDARRCCWECSHMGPAGRCLARQRGRPTIFAAAPDELNGCPSFGLAKGLA